MKKIFLRITTACLSLCAAVSTVLLTRGVSIRAAGNTEGYTEIYTAGELAAIQENPNGRYRLAADIDMSAYDWQPTAFSGTLDGAGHTLYNLKVSRTGSDVRETRDGNLKPYDTRFAGLFSTAEHAEIVDLNIVGAQIFVEDASHCFAAVLAGYVNQSSICGCSVSGRVHMINHGVNVGVGGMAGYGGGSFEKCRAEVELVLEDRYTDGRCEQFMGGMLACGTGNITDCSVTLSGWDSCVGYVHNGGLAGMYFDCGLKVGVGSVTHNSVNGQITFFENNPDRRAYCKAFIGEILNGPAAMTGNTSNFQSNELTDYTAVLLPEQCAEPHYTDLVTPADCFAWGHTDHVCETCGYRWTDSYTPPRHTESAWEIVREPDNETEGLRRKYCSVCGELLAEESLPIAPPETQGTPKTRGGTLLHWWVLIALLGAALDLIRNKK